MDKQRFMALLQKQEGPKLDFKATLSIKTDSEKKELAKDVAAIANSKGGRGYIVFGVEDKTQKILGINKKDYTEEQIQQIISQRCDPPVSVQFDFIQIEEKQIGILTIYKSYQKPHQIRQTGIFYVRRGSTTDIARRAEIANMLQECGMLQYESILIHNSDIKQLDTAKIYDYISKIGVVSSKEDYEALLESIGIIGRDEDSNRFYPTIGGLLVFGYNPQIFLPHTGIRVVNNHKKRENIYFTGSITKMLDDVEEYIKNIFEDKEYPLHALMEAVANAVVHRDYFDLGREIVIVLNNYNIEISNPGSLCGDDEPSVTIEENNPHRRNSWLYQRLVIIDNKNRFLKTGMGINKIKHSFKQVGEVKFINNDKRNLFKVILPVDYKI